MSIEIEKNKKLPRRNSGRRTKYPFGDMKVGDSFYVGPENISEKSGQFMVCAAASYYSIRRKGAKKFASRREGEGLRIWRIK